jgi:hypothetical protein
VNAFGHVVVAHRWAGPTADRGFALGSALSDLATVGGFRLLGRTDDPQVGAGMVFHHRTDDAFHAHPWFRERSRLAGGALLRSGMDRGPARACAHVGVELLLDGALQAGAEDRNHFGRALEAIPARIDRLAPLVPAGRRHAWRAHLRGLAGVEAPPAHHDPEAVAARLQRICARRPRLWFPEAAVSDVAAVLAELAPGIADTAADLVADLAADLRLPPQPGG